MVTPSLFQLHCNFSKLLGGSKCQISSLFLSFVCVCVIWNPSHDYSVGRRMARMRTQKSVRVGLRKQLRLCRSLPHSTSKHSFRSWPSSRQRDCHDHLPEVAPTWQYPWSSEQKSAKFLRWYQFEHMWTESQTPTDPQNVLPDPV